MLKVSYEIEISNSGDGLSKERLIYLLVYWGIMNVLLII